MARKLRREDYTVGWVSALPIELAAAQEMLDEEHASLEQDPDDDNLYTLGSIGEHNVVIVCLPAGQMGTTPATAAAVRMKTAFRSLRFGLMVGIGGGVPCDEADIRLGDVVISQPRKGHGGVVQYDFVTTTPDGYEQKGFLNAPPKPLLNTLAKLRANHDRNKSTYMTYLSKLSCNPKFARDATGSDVLYESAYEHVGGATCEFCSDDRVVKRKPRANQGIEVHYGTIASGNQVMRDGSTRDKVSSKFGGVFCFDMEAAGLMNDFPSLVIRGICDYADSHKNKRWQPYAAGAAAACAKELLALIPRAEVERTRTAEETTNESNDNILDLLPYATQAAFNTREKDHHSICLPDTRTSVLEGIDRWANSQNEQFIFWLNGLAGTGKSTIARTISRKYYSQNRLAASFFFSRGGGDVGYAGKFVTTIAVQLADTSTTLKTYINGAVREQSKIASLSLHDQWQQLVFTPLSKLETGEVEKSLIIVIDALDECEGDRDIQSLLRLLSSLKDLPSLRLRVFITSRPETSLRLGFRTMSEILHHDLMLNDVSRTIVDHDISIFFKEQFREIRLKFEDLSPNWPGDDIISYLVSKSEGLFIYAATVCRFIGSNDHWSPEDLLGVFIESGPEKPSEDRKKKKPRKSPFLELDKIYGQILDHTLKNIEDPQDKEDIARELKRVIGTLVVLSEPLSTAALSQLLDIEHATIRRRLGSLRSVFNVADDKHTPVHLLHPSFRDFLLDNQRCTNVSFSVNENELHRMLAEDCIGLMSEVLMQDICKLKHPGTQKSEILKDTIQQHISSETEYACLHWISHVQRSGIELSDDGFVHRFLIVHLLHWLEALGLVGKVSEAVLAISSLESHIEIQRGSLVHELVHDAKRFVLYNRSMIEQAPLQIYCSGLIFAPEKSTVRKLFKDKMPKWIVQLPNVQETWSAVLQTLESHGGPVVAMAFSPNSELLASIGSYGIYLWDVASGTLLRALKVNTAVKVMAFSLNGKLLASGGYDETYLLDVASGTPLQTLKGKEGSDVVAFSLDNKLLASSGRSGIKLWDVASGTLLRTHEAGKDNNVVAFAPDVKLLASGELCGIKLWDVASGTLLWTREADRSIKFVAFAPDGKLLASSQDGVIELWDVASGTLLRTLEASASTFRDIAAFSPDSKRLASIGPSEIRLWDVASGTSVHALRGKDHNAIRLAFSPCGTRIASSNGNDMIELWDTVSGVLKADRVDWGCANKFIFSPNGKLLACGGSLDGSVKLLDMSLGSKFGAHQHIVGHEIYVIAVAISGKFLASGYTDGRVRLWDITTSKTPLWSLKCHDASVTSVVFSPDGKLITSSNNDKTVAIWDSPSKSTTEWSRHTLDYDGINLTSIAVSPDGKLLVSKSSKMIHLWEISTGSKLWAPLKSFGNSNFAGSAATTISAQAKLLAGASWRGHIFLWEVLSGAQLHVLKYSADLVNVGTFSPDDLVNVMTFSSDEKLLACSRRNRTVNIWEVISGAMLRVFDLGAVIYSLSFSKDGTFLDLNTGSMSIDLKSDTVPSLQAYQLFDVSIGEHWISHARRKLLWLPPEYRPKHVDVRGDMIILVHDWGTPSLLEFDLSQLEL